MITEADETSLISMLKMCATEFYIDSAVTGDRRSTITNNLLMSAASELSRLRVIEEWANDAFDLLDTDSSPHPDSPELLERFPRD